MPEDPIGQCGPFLIYYFPMKILQIGLGNFGMNHLRAWKALGLLPDLTLAEQKKGLWEQAREAGLSPGQISQDYHDFLDRVDLVDIVTPTDSHHPLCCEVLNQGKDVFIEKPMTLNSDQAREIVSLIQKKRRILQVGYCFRHHPVSQYAKEAVAAGKLGKIRYLSGSFMGFKRPRTDVGVTHTDGIHFLDLFNWLLKEVPTDVYAVTRDHFGRGLEDTSIVLLNYPSGAFAKVESGYIQPGKWEDQVVPNARTTKEFFVVGTEKTIEADYEKSSLTLQDVHFEKKETTWAPRFGETLSPSLEKTTPVDMVASELSHFLDAVKHRREGGADAFSSGLVLALLIEAIYRSAKSQTPQKLDIPSFKTETLEAIS